MTSADPRPGTSPPLVGAADAAHPGVVPGASVPQPVRLGRINKAGLLLRLVGRHPIEFVDRVRAFKEVRLRRLFPTRSRYAVEPWREFLRRAGDALHCGVEWSDDEPGFAQTREMLRQRRSELSGADPFPPACDADPVLARLCYFLTLALRPMVVVETGVAFGVASSYILSALERNGQGRLISVDLPPLGISGDDIGGLIPPALRRHWTLARGTSTRLLPRLLQDVPPVGLFVHDSLFTQRNSRQEYEQVLPRLAPRAGIIANCANLSAAFADLCAKSRPSLQAAIPAEIKSELIGAAIYGA